MLRRKTAAPSPLAVEAFLCDTGLSVRRLESDDLKIIPHCGLVFMMGEVDAVQKMLSHRSPQDCAVIHVDSRWPEAFREMSSWAEGKTCDSD